MEEKKDHPSVGGWELVTGCALVAVGCGMIYLPAGVIAAGVLLAVFGVLDIIAGGDGDA